MLDETVKFIGHDILISSDNVYTKMCSKCDIF